MTENKNSSVLENICSSLDRKPKSIKGIVDETGHQRSTVSKYLKTLSKTGMIKSDKVGRQKVFWRPVLSDRQTGLELRGAAYELSNLRNNVEEAQEKIERLIEESTDPESENQSFSKQVSEKGEKKDE